MFLPSLRRLLYQISRASGRPRRPCKSSPARRLRCALRLELLEGRLAPAVILWDGGPTSTGTNWHDPVNWVGDMPPGASDDAQIGAAFAGRTITSSANVTIRSVTSTAALQITGGTFDLAAASSISNNLTLSGGMLGGAGNLTLTNGLFTWTGGSLSGSGSTTIAANATAALSGAATKVIANGYTLNNAGTLTWTGAGNIQGVFGATINNLAGALFDVRNDVRMFVNGGNGFAAFNNAGTFRKSAGSGITEIGGDQGFTFNNNGTAQVQTGTLRLGDNATTANSSGTFDLAAGTTLHFVRGQDRGHNLLAGSRISGPGTVVFSGGTVNLAGTYAVPTTVVNGGTANFNNPTAGAAATTTATLSSGALGGSGLFRINNTFTWTDGILSGTFFSGSGSTTIASGAMAVISGAATKLITRGYTLNNAGTATWTGTGDIRGIFGATINNLAGALFDVQNDARMFVDGGGGDGFFNNAGTFRKSAGTGVTDIGGAQGFTFNNTGTAQVQTGTLRLGVALFEFTTFGSSSGTFDLAAGTTLDFARGTYNLLNGASVTGAGLTLISGATVNTGASVSVGNLTLSSGTLNVGGTAPGLLAVNGNYTQAAGGSLNIQLGGLTPGTQFDRLNVTGAAALDGTLNVSRIGSFFPNFGDRFQIMASGSLTGDFATKNGLNLGGGRVLSTVIGPTSYTLALAPTVAFTTASQSAGENAGTVTITAQLSAATDQAVTVPFTVSGTASNPADYTITASPITILAGATTGTITVTLVDDSLDEANETVVVTMGTPTNAILGSVTVHTLTITDNDPPPSVSFTAANQSAAENVGTLTVTAQLSAPSGFSVTVPFTVGGTASQPADYTITPSPLTIPAGSTTATITITVVDDSVAESNETVVVTMGTPTNATPGAVTVHTVTITDNDALPSVTFTAASQSGAEDVGTLIITAQLSAVVAQAVTVPFTVGGTATSPADYTITPSPLVIPAEATTGTITITVVDDSLDEPNETVIVTMGTPVNATPGAITVHTATILDNDPPPALSINDVSVTEGNSGTVAATFTVTLSAASGLTVTVQYATADGTAAAPGDYQPDSGTLTFAPGGPLTQTVTVTVNGDTVSEADETFFVNLSNAANATLADDQGQGTIVNDDTPPPPPPPPPAFDPGCTNPNQCFVARIYLDLLKRPADPAGLAHYAGLLDRGTSREKVVAAIQSSREYHTRQVQDVYQSLLGRPADPTGLDVHVRFLERGGSVDVVNACVLVSEEYFQRHGGGSNTGWLRALYQEVLGREIDASGAATFGALLARGATRELVATSLLASAESRQRLVQDLYQQLLRRPGDAGGLSNSVSFLQRGGREEQVIAGMLSSEEYFRRS